MSYDYNRDHKEFRDSINDAPNSIKKFGTHIILPFLLLSLCIGAFGFVTGIFGEAADTAQETYGAKAAVRKYEWFKDKYNNIQNYDVQYKTAVSSFKTFKKDAGPRSDWTFEDKQEYSRLQSVAQGLRNQRNSVVAEYNSASEKATWSVFQTNDLPRRIPLLP